MTEKQITEHQIELLIDYLKGHSSDMTPEEVVAAGVWLQALGKELQEKNSASVLENLKDKVGSTVPF